MEKDNMHIHTFKDTVVPPTCKEPGYTLHKCECGYEHKDNFKPVDSHNFELLEETKPTCTEKGLRTLKCSICGEVKSFEIDALGHEWGEWNVNNFATCTEDGKQTRVCSRCGQTQEQIIGAKGHKLSSPQKSKTQKGMVEYFCENCGQTITMKSKTRRALKKILLFVALPLVLIAAITFASVKFAVPYYHYSTAKKYIEENKNTRAFHHLTECIDFKDSKELIRDFSIVFKTEENEYGYEVGNEMEVHKSRSEAEFDKNGNIISATSYVYDEDDKYTGKNVHEYDKNGNNTLYASYDKNDKCTSKTVTEYNKKGDIILTKEYDGKKLESTTTYKHEYDSKGNKISSASDDWKCEYEYYNNGELKAERNYDGDGEIEYALEYRNDGTLKKEMEYDSGQVYSTKEYNKYGYIASYSIKDNKMEFSYKYDEFDNPIQCTFGSGKESGKKEWEYDNYGKLISYKVYHNGELAEKSTWEYDYEKEKLECMHERYSNGRVYSYEKFECSEMEIKYTPELDNRVGLWMGDPFNSF